MIVSKSVHYQSIEVLKTYTKAQDIEVVEVDLDGTVTDLEKLKAAIDDDTAAVCVQYPNFGSLEDLEAIKQLIEDKKLYLLYQVILYH